MSGRYLLGLDIGTSVVKAALFDQAGREGAVASSRTSLLRPRPDWVEASLDETWQMAASAIRTLLPQAGLTGADVAAVGVTGNMVGAWLVDAQGQPVRPGILWCDARSRPLVERLSRHDPAFLSKIYQTSGSALEFGCTLPILRWLAEHEPWSLERAQTVLCCKDWIVFKLTGSRHLDPTEASVLPGDTRRRGYSEAMVELWGLTPWRSLLPPVQPSETIVGYITPEAAALTDLLAGTPVVAGAGDVPASTLGAGAIEPGAACTVLGTTCHNGLVVAEPLFEPPEVGLLFCLPGERWLRVMVNLAGTSNLDWFIEQFCGLEAAQAPDPTALLARVESLAHQSPPGANGVLFHPYLGNGGVIAPFVEPAARGQFFGLSARHTRADLLRAVYEGVAYAIRDCYQAMTRPSDVRLAGGGARSPFWSQLIADVAGWPVIVPAGREFGAKGAALLAGVGLGWFENIAQAVASADQIVRRHTPNPRLRLLYDDGYDLYRQLRDDLRPAWQRQAQP